jgi:hypothetical protein
VRTRIGEQLSRDFLMLAIETGAFMRFDAATHQYVATPLHEAIVALNNAIGKLKFSQSTPGPVNVQKYIAEYAAIWMAGQSANVPNAYLAFPCGDRQLIDAISAISRAVYRSLNGDQSALQGST